MSLKVRRDVWAGDMHLGIELGIEELSLVKSKDRKKEYSSPGIICIICFQYSYK